MVNETVIEFGLSMMFEDLYADRERCYPPRQKADSIAYSKENESKLL